MIRRPRYYFNKELKNDFLKGRKLTYLSERLGISYSYLSSVIQGKNAVDDFFIHDLIIEIGYNEKDLRNTKKEYFTLRDDD